MGRGNLKLLDIVRNNNGTLDVIGKCGDGSKVAFRGCSALDIAFPNLILQDTVRRGNPGGRFTVTFEYNWEKKDE